MGAEIEWLDASFPTLSKIVPMQQGGQKWVYSCEHIQYGACVLKLIKPGASQRIDREIEAVERLQPLSSSNVPQIYDSGTVESQIGPLIFLLEQRVDGIDLSEMLKRDLLSREQVLKLALDLVSAAADAERVHVVHRDIKPKNIKIDATGRAWLLDFGIARILDLESRTRTDAVVGPHSPGYSAPEQFKYRKSEIDGRSDLFAIGVVLYESATGTNPFLEGARDAEEVLHRVEQDPLPRLELEWDNERLFADFVSQLTQKYPYQRVPSCTEALAWLCGVIDQLGDL